MLGLRRWNERVKVEVTELTRVSPVDPVVGTEEEEEAVAQLRVAVG
jgi:hypothetical protein